uniref:Transposase n=1 Tax=Candidatus Kentrum sp. MB TaxID=2138164 RepID=A0A450XTY7_9GAMM|nr:MAG: hypothetical protein BECKMB1821G_GA0114241_11238 [Candidatus Kentron sp. MB]VFK35777.1 MAG: hypothetical protein BECKMB1821I_GA0114274_11451 [Candidatus Kentron sp. MB]VFK77382.1 MAG: hypothetical protein BECKMB1821H_GA0114242_11307 [Candidatus Kentron sp. MB]
MIGGRNREPISVKGRGFLSTYQNADLLTLIYIFYSI